MKEWRSALVSPDAAILKAIEVINNSSLQIALVVDAEMRLMGMVTDGDIRRAILRNVALGGRVESIMVKDYTVALVTDSQDDILALMRRKDLRHVPIVDQEGRVVDLWVLKDFVKSPPRLENWVVLMAGGSGSRLRPLTEAFPKPLLEVGGKPLLERILLRFVECGLYKIFISVHYKADLIEELIGNGERWGIEIVYLREETKLGTAGALGLLPGRPRLPFFVMNSDLLTKINFKQFLDFHIQTKSIGTMCVKQYDIKIPYGVVNVDGSQLLNLEEKPVHRFFVNAGIYLLEPEVLDLIPEGQYCDMTTVFEELLRRGRRTATFPIHEYWLDIGRVGDYERANGEYLKHFEP